MEMISRISCFITFPWVEVRLVFPWISPTILEDRSNLCFSQVFKHFPVAMTGEMLLRVTSKEHHSASVVHMSNTTQSYGFRLVLSSYLFPNLILLHQAHLLHTFLLQINPQVSGSWDSWRLVLLVKTNMKKVFSTSAFFHVLCYQVTWRELANIFLIFLLFPIYLNKPFSFCLWHPKKFNCIWGRAFLTSSLVLPGYFLFLPLSVGFLFVSEFGQSMVGSSMQTSWHS